MPQVLPSTLSNPLELEATDPRLATPLTFRCFFLFTCKIRTPHPFKPYLLDVYLVTVRNTGSRVNTTHRLQERLTNTKVRQSIKSQDIMKNKEQREKCRRGWPEEMTSKTNQKEVQLAQLVGSLVQTPKGCGFDPQSGCIQEAINQVFTLPLSLQNQYTHPPLVTLKK